MTRKRLTAGLVGMALTAAACSSGASIDTADSTSDPSAAATPELNDAPAPTETDDPVDVELVSPTETDRPLDLTGGTTTGSDDVTVETESPRAGLDGNVAQATEPWPTDWTRRTVDIGELQLGIQAVDPRDRIPPIDLPKFEPLANATWLDDREPGALVQFNDEVRFYPLSILTRHEVVNDRFGDIPVIVTFCPLCNTAITFDARVDGEVLRFGVSGLLRNSDLVMWDDATTSLWQQITGEAVVGELAGTQLEIISTSIVSYGDALEGFPEALSLSRETGFGIVYGANPYQSYSSSETPFLFSGDADPRFPALSRVVGVNLDGSDKAYPFSLISEKRAVNDEIGETPIAVFWGGDTADALDGATVAEGQAIGSGIAYSRVLGDEVLTFSSAGDDLFTDAETGSTWTLLGEATDGPLAGEQLETVPHRNEFWFAWASFFPDAPVYSAA